VRNSGVTVDGLRSSQNRTSDQLCAMGLLARLPGAHRPESGSMPIPFVHACGPLGDPRVSEMGEESGGAYKRT